MTVPQSATCLQPCEVRLGVLGPAVAIEIFRPSPQFPKAVRPRRCNCRYQARLAQPNGNNPRTAELGPPAQSVMFSPPQKSPPPGKQLDVGISGCGTRPAAGRDMQDIGNRCVSARMVAAGACPLVGDLFRASLRSKISRASAERRRLWCDSMDRVAGASISVTSAAPYHRVTDRLIVEQTPPLRRAEFSKTPPRRFPKRSWPNPHA